MGDVCTKSRRMRLNILTFRSIRQSLHSAGSHHLKRMDWYFIWVKCSETAGLTFPRPPYTSTMQLQSLSTQHKESIYEQRSSILRRINNRKIPQHRTNERTDESGWTVVDPVDTVLSARGWVDGDRRLWSIGISLIPRVPRKMIILIRKPFRGRRS